MSATGNKQARGGEGSRGLRNVLPVTVTLVCATLFCFLSGGYILTRSAPIAIVYLLLAAVWIWFLRRGFWPSPLFLAALAAFGLFVGWAGLSVLWSFGPDLSWIAFDIAAFYLAVVAVVGFTPVRRLQLRVAAWGFLGLAASVAVYAFLGKGLPDVVKHAYTYARLDSPIGYWNVLALVMVLGIVVVLSLAADRSLHPILRAAASAAAVPMAFTFFFTFSRGGWVALAVALLAYFAFTTSRLASLATLAAVVGPVALVLWRLRDMATLFSATTNDALRTAEGHDLLRWAIAALLVTAGAQLAVALVQGAVVWPRWSRILAGAAVAVILVGGTATASWRFLEPRGGATWLRERVHVAFNDSDARDTGNAAGRLISLNTGRPPLWREALRQSRHDRLTGAGAGTFPFTHFRFRDSGGVVRHAHSQWLNVLSELGVVGLVLFVVAMALLVAACVGNPFGHRRDPMRPTLAALQASVLAFIVHISWDWDWDMAAAGTIVFLFVALAASYQSTRKGDERRAATGAAGAGANGIRLRQDGAHTTEAADAADAADPAAEAGATALPSAAAEPQTPAADRRSRTGSWPLRLAASAALAVLALSWAVPYASAVYEDRAVSAAGKGEALPALSAARRAARLDPLAVTPLLVEAAAMQQLGRNREALAVVRQAQALQPANFETYYQEGLLQLEAFGRRRAALEAFRRALALNPFNGSARSEIQALAGR